MKRLKGRVARTRRKEKPVRIREARPGLSGSSSGDFDHFNDNQTISIMMMLMWMRSKDQGGLALGCRGYQDMIVMINILRGNNSQCRFKKPNCIVK